MTQQYWLLLFAKTESKHPIKNHRYGGFLFEAQKKCEE
jgi:hypothetical protein